MEVQAQFVELGPLHPPYRVGDNFNMLSTELSASAARRHIREAGPSVYLCRWHSTVRGTSSMHGDSESSELLSRIEYQRVTQLLSPKHPLCGPSLT